MKILTSPSYFELPVDERVHDFLRIKQLLSDTQLFPKEREAIEQACVVLLPEVGICETTPSVKFALEAVATLRDGPICEAHGQVLAPILGLVEVDDLI